MAELVLSLQALLSGERDCLTNSAQFVAFLMDQLPDLNWVGFYWHHKGLLKLGPFQSKPACHPIPIDKGVCAQSFRQQQVLNVPDVHAFPGHIACDVRSRSELVLPVVIKGRCVGVLDIDAPRVARFSSDDVAIVQALLHCFMVCTDIRIYQ